MTLSVAPTCCSSDFSASENAPALISHTEQTVSPTTFACRS
jgi:hypothetical protein